MCDILNLFNKIILILMIKFYQKFLMNKIK
jgi:hypothetical protein